MEIKSKILKTALVRWKSLRWLQGELKEMTKTSYQQLRQSLITNGFIAPFHLWQDEKGSIWILDGHHRKKVMEELEKEGYKIPVELPGIWVDCKSKKEALGLLIVYSSIYAKITEDGFYEMLMKNKIDLLDLKPMIEIPDFNLNKF